MTSEIDPSSTFEKPLRKYYHPKMVRVGTFIGGPLVTAYLAAENYKAFGKPGKVGLSWFYALMFCAFLVVLICVLPGSQPGSNNGSFKYIIPLLYSWGAYALINYLQADLIEEHVNAGGVSYSWGRVVLVSIIGFVIFFTMVFGVLIVLSNIFPTLLPD